MLLPGGPGSPPAAAAARGVAGARDPTGAPPPGAASQPVVAESADSRCSSTVEPTSPWKVSRVGPESIEVALPISTATTSCTSAGSTSAGTTTNESLLVDRPYAVDTVTGPGTATG